MNTPRDRLEYILAIFILLAAGLPLVISCYHAWPFTTDDAFISWRYADHVAQGAGLRWNLSSPPVEGYSNFAWVMLVGLFIKLGLPVVAMVKLTASLSLLAALVFLYRFSRTFLSPLPATLPIYLFSHYNGVAWWTVSGLETSLFVALVLFISWQSARAMGFKQLQPLQSMPHNYKPSAWILSCLGLLLLALTRFDGIVWSFIVAVFVGCCLWHSKENSTSSHLLPGSMDNSDFDVPRTSRETNFEEVLNKPVYFARSLDPANKSRDVGFLGANRQLALIFILFFVLPYTIYFGWRLFYFGQLLPNSYVCKASSSGYTFELLLDYFPIAFPCLILGLPYLFARKDCRHILLWLPSLIYALLLYHANPNIAYYNRLFLGAFSVLTILPVLGMKEFFSYFHWSPKNNALASTIVILLFTLIFIPSNQLDSIDMAVKHYQQRQDMRRQLALQLNQDVAYGTRVLLADCGVIPFYARKDIQFIDSLCLNNREMAHRKTRHTLMLYTNRLQNVIKPEWVIDTYYPALHHGNDLNDQLRKAGFYNDYKMVKSYSSHEFSYKQGKLSQQEEDFVYFVYKRKSKP